MTGRKTNRTKRKELRTHELTKERLVDRVKEWVTKQNENIYIYIYLYMQVMSDWRSISAWDTVRFIFIRLCGITVMWPPSMFWYLGVWFKYLNRHLWLKWDEDDSMTEQTTHSNLPLGEWFLLLPALRRLKINEDQTFPWSNDCTIRRGLSTIPASRRDFETEKASDSQHVTWPCQPWERKIRECTDCSESPRACSPKVWKGGFEAYLSKDKSKRCWQQKSYILLSYRIDTLRMNW